LIESSEYAAIAPKLVNCATDVTIPNMVIDLPKSPASMKDLMRLKDQYGLGASIDRVINAFGWS
jgi:hypothetical protein